MRAGVKARVARLARVTGAETRRWSSPVVLAVLASGALAPLLVSGVSVAALAALGIGFVGSVGGGVLTDLVKKGVNSLGGGASPQGDLEAELERRIQEVLEAGGENAERLRGELAQVLREVGAVGAAVEAAVQTGDRKLQADLAAGLARVGQEFTEFGFMLADMGDQLRLIREGVDQNNAELQVSVGLQYRQATDIRLLLEQVAAIQRWTRPDGASGVAAGPRWADGSPWRGLVPYGQADAEVFCGRELVTAELVSTLSHRLPRAGLLVVTGASGAGKSSLLRAGLIPAISRGELSEPARDWPRQVLDQPTRAPLSRLAVLLAGMAGLDAPTVLRTLIEEPQHAPLLARQALDADGRRRDLPPDIAAGCRLILVVDQFEEIFAIGEQAAAERAAFIAALHAMATIPNGAGDAPAALVVIVVRGDFIDRCADHPQLAAALRDGPFIVGPMTEPDLRAAIVAPADAAGLDIEPGLVDTILGELRTPAGGYDAGALPLLSQTMLTIWQHREDRRLTSRGYALTGGVRHAVASSAEAAYTGLSPEQQDLARHMFRRLTTVARDGRLTRRTIDRAVLYADRDDQQRTDIEQVIEGFARQRLIAVDTNSAQITHDILLQAWPRLRTWMDPDLTSHALHSQLIDDASDWDRNNRAASYLYRGERLTSILHAEPRWQADPLSYPALTDVQRAFLDAGVYAENRSKRQRRLVLATLSGLLVLALVLTSVAFIQRQSAQQQQRIATEQQRIATTRLLITQAETARDTNPHLALLLGIAADGVYPGTEAQSGLIQTLTTTRYAGTLTGHDQSVSSVVFSPDRRTLATFSLATIERPAPTDTDGDAAIPEPALPARPSGASGPTTSVSPTGSPDTVTTTAGSITLWDVSAPGPPRRFGPPLLLDDSGRGMLAFSPDGRLLATGGDSDEAIDLWDVSDPARPTRQGSAAADESVDITSVAFSPDGQTLAAGNDEATVTLWDVSDPAQATRLGVASMAGTAYVDSVAFAPDGQVLAAGSDDAVRLWNVTDPAHPAPLGAPLAGRSPLAFSAAGGLLVTHNRAETNNNSFILWDVSNPARPARFDRRLSGNNSSVALTPDGHTAATTGFNGTAVLWDITDPTRPTPSGSPLAGHTDYVLSAAFSPDGQTLATGSRDRTAILWDLTDATQLPERQPPQEGVDSMVFLHDGTALAAGSTNEVVSLWDPSDPGRLASGQLAVPGVFSKLSPDGRTLAVLDTDDAVTLWDISNAADPVKRGPPLSGSGLPVLFSPDGLMLITGDEEMSMLWDVADPARPIRRVSDLPAIIVLAAAFAPDGRTLATSSFFEPEGEVNLWDVTDPARPTTRPVPVLAGDSAYVTSLSFSPDSRTLTTGRTDGTIVLWDVSDLAQPARIGQPLAGPSDPDGGGFTFTSTASVSAAAFSTDGRTLATINVSNTIILWNLTDRSSPHQLGPPFSFTSGLVVDARFSPDGRTLATASTDGTLTLWDLTGIKDLQEHAVQRACAITGRGFDRAEWARHVAGLPYQQTCT
jgi:WD40 repeat protein